MDCPDPEYRVPRKLTPRRWSCSPPDPRATPKAVPLSHRNLLTNLRASLAVLQASRNDVLLGFLPPFHSFGLLANVLAPVLAGIRVAHYPDPTDAAGLVRTVAAYKATIMVTTPTFLSYMFGTARPADLASLRIIVSGAEKCPETALRTRHTDGSPGVHHGRLRHHGMLAGRGG